MVLYGMEVLLAIPGCSDMLSPSEIASWNWEREVPYNDFMAIKKQNASFQHKSFVTVRTPI